MLRGRIALRARGLMGGGFSPLSLFAASEPGFWFDPSDLSTLFQDAAGTTPVTAAGQFVGLMLDKSGRGNHATQSTSLSRPTYQVDSNGRGYLNFDGSDDFLVTPTITPGTDKAQVFAGVRKLSDAAQGVVADWGAPAAAGAFTIQAPSAGGGVNRYLYTQYGSAAAALPFITDVAYAAPHTAVFTGYGDIAADVNIARINGVQAATSTTDQGTGNFSAAACYIGRRNGSTLPFNGRLYGLITRFGPNLTAARITQVENWMNGKTGAY